MLNSKKVIFSWLCLQIVLSLIAAQVNTADATVCEPRSRFKIDCNTCYCSVNGRRYKCTTRFCSSDVSLNLNDFMADEPQADQRVYFDDATDDWVGNLNDLAPEESNNVPEKRSNAPKQDEDEDEYEFGGNSIDYGDYVKEQAQYRAAPRKYFRY